MSEAHLELLLGQHLSSDQQTLYVPVSVQSTTCIAVSCFQPVDPATHVEFEEI